MNDGLGLLLSKFDAVRKSGGSWMVRCPAHPDSSPSLSISEGTTQPAVLNCHAGCDPELILAALGLTWADLCVEREPDQRGEWTPFGEAVAVYDYVDEDGDLLFQVLRTVDKQFPTRTRDRSTKSGWSWKLGDTRRVLYRLPRLPEAIAAGSRIFVVEGEKDVHAIEAVGEVATCSPAGAGKWRDEYAVHLTEANVVIVADRDTPGQRHARQVAASILPVAASVTVCEARAGKDAADHLAAGLGLDDLDVVSQGEDTTKPDMAPDLYEFLAEPDVWDWVVPGLLERGDRLVLTGVEGLGKSTVGFQMAVCLAAGVHPFDFQPIDPVRVLVVDCENGRMHTRRQFRPLAAQAERVGRAVPKGGLRIIVRPEGLDLCGEDDAAWLVERVTAHQPDVLFVGPVYRLHQSNPNDELPARRTVAVLDAARGASNCALVIEAHAGHGTGKDGKRLIRPTGASLWMRWPEFGFGIRQKSDSKAPPRHEVDLVAWRGPRDERDWPDELHRSKDGWPWIGVWHRRERVVPRQAGVSQPPLDYARLAAGEREVDDQF